MNPQPIPEPRDPPDNPGRKPKGTEPGHLPGHDETPATMAEMGRPVPVAYGTVKCVVSAIEKLVALQQDPPAWAALTLYVPGFLTSNGGNAYEVTAGGTSAASGGPSGTGSAITDGTVTWKYRQQLPCPIYFQRFIGAICEGPAQAGLNLWRDKELIPAFSGTLFAAAMELRTGPDAANQVLPGTPGVPWDSTGYQHTVLIVPSLASPGIPSGTQKELPNFAIELQSVMFGAATADVNPADIVNDLITHARRGAGLPGSRVDASITGTGAGGYRVYADAAGLRISMLLDQQKSALTWIDSVFQSTNCDWLWDGGVFVASPLGDQPLASPVYGATGYVPANAVQFNLTADDFLDKLNPVSFDRREDPACFNTVPVEYINRARGYAKQVEEAPDALDVEKRGGKVSSSTMSLPVIFPDGLRPVMLSQIWTQRSLKVRNTYRFRLSWKYVSLRPGDLVTLTDTVLGLSLVPVRITTFEEAEDGTIQFTAVDYPAAVQAAVPYAPQAGNGYKANEAATLQTAPPLTGVVTTADRNVQVGPYPYSTAWARILKAIEGDSLTAGGNGVYWWRGMIDPTDGSGGKPVINAGGTNRLDLQGYPSLYCVSGVNNAVQAGTAAFIRLQVVIQPQANSDNLDSLRYIEFFFYTAAGALVAANDGTHRFPLTDRLYNTAGTPSSANNAVLQMVTCMVSNQVGLVFGVAPFAPNCYIRAKLYNAYGASDSRDYSFITNTIGGAAPSSNAAGFIPTQGAPPAGSGGGGSGYCPTPDARVLLASGATIRAGDLVDGMDVLGFKERDFAHEMVGRTRYVSHELTPMLYAVKFADGRVQRYSQNHRLCSIADGWTMVQDLKPGTELVARTPSVVASVHRDGPGGVVGFIVEGTHTYFTDDVLSHNTKPSIP